MPLPLIVYVLMSVYLASVNLYGVLIVIFQKKAVAEGDEHDPSVGDVKLYVAGALGGAVGIYACMFILRYRLKSLCLMIFMPLFIALTVYLCIMAFTGNFNFY